MPPEPGPAEPAAAAPSVVADDDVAYGTSSRQSGNGAMAEPDREAELEEGRMPLLDHLIELRNRLMWSIGAIMVAFLICYQFKDRIYGFLVHPLAVIFEGQTGRHLIYTGLTEAFFTYVKVSFWAALCLSFPIVATQIWKFVAPGLYKNERRAFLPLSGRHPGAVRAWAPRSPISS